MTGHSILHDTTLNISFEEDSYLNNTLQLPMLCKYSIFFVYLIPGACEAVKRNLLICFDVLNQCL
jgi:hypothetical protein